VIGTAVAARATETLRLIDVGSSLIGWRDVGVQCSPDGVRVQHGAARCGQNCGHLVVSRLFDLDRAASGFDRRAARLS